ncbi:MAG: LamG domain-containing protein [Lachnospiraceae bacterium]|nr:LamG domain-containing protein [Lachnospiraceae bacterium]
MGKGKRILALFLAFAMVVTSVNLSGWTTVKAEETNEPEKLAYFSFDEAPVNGVFTGTGAKATINLDGNNAVAKAITDDKAVGNGSLNLSEDAFLSVTKTDGSTLLDGSNEEITISYYSKPGSTGAGWAYFIAPNSQAPWDDGEEDYLGVLDTSATLKLERYATNRNNDPSMSASRTADWSRIDVVYEKASTTVYVNGIKQNTQSNTEPICGSDGSNGSIGTNGIFYIGKATWGSGEYYHGLIDNFTVYGEALTEDQIKAEYVKSEVIGSVTKSHISLDRLREDLTLPSSVTTLGETIAWTSSDVAVISDTGAINDTAADGATATLTGTITYNEANYTVEIPVTINKAVTATEGGITYDFNDNIGDAIPVAKGLSDYDGAMTFVEGRSGEANDKALDLNKEHGLELPYYNMNSA